MNERIRELAIQVQRTEMPGVLFAHPEFVEKFAKLMVKECMAQIQEVREIKTHLGTTVSDYTQGFDDGLFVAIRTIEEDFGVEE